ncbi:hypothetical protein K438DRAFT_226272 [Mycena galopus ATCC 62051]|nr:hypothetical protein K438DRAFT_226272 [Mycena galopus ATCC 62051]
MSGHPKPKLLTRLKKIPSKLKKAFGRKGSPTPSRQASRGSTPPPSTRQESAPGATISTPNPQSGPNHGNNGQDSLKGGDTAHTDIPDIAQSQPGSDLHINPYLEFTHTLPPMWEAWNIDGDSISQLQAWGAGHESSKWRKLAEKIHDALESKTCEAIQEFIPDSPFPAKTLVKALLSIVQLGINVPRIQKEVHEFAQEAIEYIRTLVEVAGGEPNAREDLEAICTAVNDICKWASEHVRKNTSSDHELGDWRSQFTQAKERFSARTLLKIRVEQAKDQRKNLIKEELDFIKEKLAKHVAAQHTFTDQSKSLCAPGTRVQIKEDIEKWLSPQLSNSEHIFWITGIAGSGKSTLSATVVDNLRKTHTPVAAQFFISRNIPETVDPKKLVPTIAKQLAEFSPAAARVIHAALKDGFPSSLAEQVEALLLAPIQEMCKSYDRVVILIDALDELRNAAESVEEMLSLIAPRDCHLPENIRFVITSRPEHWAHISESEILELSVFKQYLLGTESSVNEVHSFIIARLQEINTKGPKWDKWPSDYQVSKLSEKADGLFHYAATALQWIKEQVRKPGMGKVYGNQLFEKFTEMGDGQLEELYRLILTSFENIDVQEQDTDWQEDRLRNFRHVIGTILVLDEPLTIGQITALLGDISEDDFNVANFLRQMRSVLIPGTTASFEEARPQTHKSFRDYITSDHAPAEFRIHTGHAHFVTARSCMEVIVKGGTESDVYWEYCIWHWHKHLRKAWEHAEEKTWEDERMWNMFGQVVEKAAGDVWERELWPVFIDVATVGWGLLEKGTDKQRMGGISSILMKVKVCGCACFPSVARPSFAHFPSPSRL